MELPVPDDAFNRTPNKHKLRCELRDHYKIVAIFGQMSARQAIIGLDKRPFRSQSGSVEPVRRGTLVHVRLGLEIQYIVAPSGFQANCRVEVLSAQIRKKRLDTARLNVSTATL
jgi:hypothetical protein